MRTHPNGVSPRRAFAPALALALLCAFAQHAPAAGSGKQAGAHGNRDRTLVVMTRNMYLGTDFGGVFAAQTPEQLLGEVGAAFANVQAGNVPARVAAIAAEIADARPALVGLHEVALWRTGAPFDPAPADSTAYDFLQLLLAELAARGQHYAPVAVLTNFTAEVPGAVGPGQFIDVSFTDRDVVLARTDLSVAELKIESVAAENFQTSLPVATASLGTITIPRGWIAVNAKTRGKRFRFVATHLESFFQPAQFAQALELLSGPLDTALPVVLVGDLNTDAESDNPADVATYQLLINSGFADAWDATHPDEAGYTWPLFLTTPFAYTPPAQRLDYALSRGTVTPLATTLVGEDDVTPSAPMPSDHAGVAASFRLEP